jgi:hypothetical protein
MMDEPNEDSNESFHTLPRLFVGSKLGENVQLTTRDHVEFFAVSRLSEPRRYPTVFTLVF